MSACWPRSMRLRLPCAAWWRPRSRRRRAIRISLPLQIMFLLTFLTLLPSLLISVTSFTRILIVCHFLRQALGTQTVPNNQILIGLALFLTFFIMAPVGEKVHTQALQPMLDGQI